MSNAAYDYLRSSLPAAGVDWLTANIKATLVDASYVYSATHENYSDLGSSVIGGITDQAVNVTGVSTVGEISADSITFSGATASQTVQAVVLYVDQGGGSLKLLWFFDTGAGFPLTTTGADVSVDWNASAGNGIVFKLT